MGRLATYRHDLPDALPFDPEVFACRLRSWAGLSARQAGTWRRAFLYLIDSVRDGVVENVLVTGEGRGQPVWTDFLIRHPDSGLWRGEFRVSAGGTAAFFALIPA